jgi:transcriptional antiterminator RfaH
MQARDTELHWYAVSTKANHEKQAEQNMRRLGIECFLPLLQETKIIRRSKTTVISPLFPGYFFVRINLTEHYRTVTFARGVRRIVSFGVNPAEIDTAVIDAIKNKVSRDQVYAMEHVRNIESGQHVHIQEGPLAGLDAVFVREMPGRQRAMVLLHALALQARAEINIDQLAPYVAA